MPFLPSVLKRSGSLLLAFGLIGLGPAQAALIAYDDFNYTATANVTGQNGGTGAWSGGWAASTGDNSTVVTNGGLTYTGLPTAGNAAMDNSFSSLGNTRAWTAPGGLFADGSELWFSALVNTSAAGSDLRLFALTSANVGGGGVGFSLAGSGVRANLGTSVSGTLAGTSGTTMLLVARIQFSDTPGADAVTAWVNPAISATPPSPGSGVLLSGDIASGLLSAPLVGYRGGGGWQGTVDEFRIGTTYGDVVAIPEPAVMSLSMMAGLGLLLGRRSRRR